MPDAPGARYLIVDHLREDAKHLLLARDEALGRDVVIKLIRAPTSFARVAVAREARVTANLRHPNVVVVHEVDPEGTYLVLEHLDSDMRELQGIDPKLILDGFCQAGRGLAAAHARGIWHLDVKPENILVHLEKDRAGGIAKLWAKVADFGVAQNLGACRGLEEPARVRGSGPVATASTGPLPSTRAGQRAGGDLEDQHAFAVALWEVFTGGRRPPDGAELLPPELHGVLSRALMDDPSQRWADMTALVDALERGRTSTAAASRTMGGALKTTQLIDWAIAQAEDGLFSSACLQWREAKDVLADQPDKLGEGGLALGATLLEAANEASGPARRRGFARSVDVLEDAFHYFKQADDPGNARHAILLAARACDRWQFCHPVDSPEQLNIQQRADELRARH